MQFKEITCIKLNMLNIAMSYTAVYVVPCNSRSRTCFVMLLIIFYKGLYTSTFGRHNMKLNSIVIHI